MWIAKVDEIVGRYDQCHSDASVAWGALEPVERQNFKDRMDAWGSMAKVQCLLTVFTVSEGAVTIDMSKEQTNNCAAAGCDGAAACQALDLSTPLSFKVPDK